MACLYALRFEAEGGRVRQLLGALEAAGVRARSPALMAAAEYILGYAGAERWGWAWRQGHVACVWGGGGPC